jgi:hypothetical protein
LANGDGEAADRKPEYHDGYARAHPGEKGALVGQVVAGAVGGVSGYGLRIAARLLWHLFNPAILGWA